MGFQVKEFLKKSGVPVSNRLEELERHLNDYLDDQDYVWEASLQHANDKRRQVRSNSSQPYDPEDVYLTIRFIPKNNRETTEEAFIRELERCSSELEFVSLTWFRDKHLPGVLPNIFPSSEESRSTLNELISKGIVLTNYIPNPDPEKPRTTTLLLNYQHSEVKKVQAASQRVQPKTGGLFPKRFPSPLQIQGKPLSKTVLENRR